MATELLLILDDDSGAFTYGGGEWTLSTLVQWYKQTSWYPGFAITGTDFGSFTMEFEGTSAAFIGNTPQSVLSQTATVSIDGGASQTITYGNTPPPAYVQWYQSPQLSAGKHTIEVGHLATTAVDYAIVKVGPQTPLSGKTIIVDNESPSIAYTGSWARNPNQFNAGTLPDGYPYGNSTHISSTVGDSVSFRFTGTSASVYGVFSWVNIGVLSATYTLDGDALPQSYAVTSSSKGFVEKDGEAVNFLLFSSGDIPAGDHTLVINITRCQEQTFMLDYITYTPSFATLSSMPNLSPVISSSSGTGSSTINPTSTPSGTGASGPSGSTSSGSNSSGANSSGGTSSGSDTPNSNIPGSQVNQNGGNQGEKSTPVGPIVGGVLGGLLLLALVALFWLWFRRRSSKRGDHLTPSNPSFGDANVNPQNQMQEQLSPVRRVYAHPPAASGTISPFQDSEMDPPTHYGFASMNDVKRERADSSDFPRSTVSPPLSPGSRGDIYGSTATDCSTSPEFAGPPSYDALSTHRRSELP